MKESLLAAVGFDEGNLLGTAPGELQVFQGLFINRKNSAGRAVLRRHVRDSRAIGERQVAQPGTEVLDKLSDDPMLAQHLGDGENKISSSRPLPQSPHQLYSHNQRNQHGNRLPEHRSFGLNSTHAPPQNPQTIDHGRVAVGAY